MNTQDTQDTQNLAKIQKEAEKYQKILACNRRYYQNRWDTDMDFRIKETKRNSEAIMRKYNDKENPQYRLEYLAKAKQRYHAKKAMMNRDKDKED